MSGDRQRKFGTLKGDLSFLKDKVDFWLAHFPELYLAVERRREWINWDKRVYLSFIGVGDVVLDVGANVGAHSVFFSHLVRGHGRVVAFEPLLPNIESMRRLLSRRARHANVEVVHAAVGNPAPGVSKTTISVPGSDLTQASLAPQSAGSWSGEGDIKSVECPCISIDSSAVVQRLRAVDFIKLDVEGAELLALRGGADAAKAGMATDAILPGTLIALLTSNRCAPSSAARSAAATSKTGM